jgi:hypothetical protein
MGILIFNKQRFPESKKDTLFQVSVTQPGNSTIKASACQQHILGRLLLLTACHFHALYPCFLLPIRAACRNISGIGVIHKTVLWAPLKINFSAESGSKKLIFSLKIAHMGILIFNK